MWAGQAASEPGNTKQHDELATCFHSVHQDLITTYTTEKKKIVESTGNGSIHTTATATATAMLMPHQCRSTLRGQWGWLPCTTKPANLLVQAALVSRCRRGQIGSRRSTKTGL